MCIVGLRIFVPSWLRVFVSSWFEVGRPGERYEQPEGAGCGDGEGCVIEETDRQESEDERTRLAPEPDVLMQHVEQYDRSDGNALTHETEGLRIYYPPMSEVEKARAELDAHTREIINWHFDPATGSPFWLDFAKKLGWDPRKEIQRFDDLSRFPAFEDEWLRGGPVQRWIPKGFNGKPVFVFETGGTTGIPKTRVAFEDFRTDYELFSRTLPDEYFPKGSNWLMLGPSGPRRLRLAVEHLAQYRGGISFCVDLDPRWVIKLIKKGWLEHLEAYKGHVIDQAVSILQAGHDIRCMFTTPKLLEALALRLESIGTSIRQAGITGIFSGGTEFTPQWNRFAHEELLDGAYMTPTYGNTLMGLAASAPTGPENNYKITYHAPQPRAVIEVVDFDDASKLVDYGQTGRVKLTTLTREFFVPGFLERDEGERERPHEKYPWDGVSGVRPFRGFAATTTVGVY
jgi:phenylacetate-coenzyme A ligase PaaK-like adenylate-forming protein